MPTTVRSRPRPVRLTSPRPARGRAPAPRPPTPVEPSRRVRRWVGAVAGLIALIALVATIVLRSSYFAVDAVQLHGEARTSPGAVESALAIDPGTPLALLDTDAAEERIAALPWVDEVDVTRGWPSTVRVRIREHAPAAAIGPENGAIWAVVGRDGTVLERRLTPPVGLPVVVVPVAVSNAAEVGTTVTPALPALSAALQMPLQLRPWIDSWTVDVDGVVAAELRGSARAVFGVELDHRTQYVSLASILGGDIPRACIRTIDLTIPDTPVVHRDRDCLLVAREL